MKKSSKLLLSILCVVWTTLNGTSLWAMDFGLVLDQNAIFSGYNSQSSFDYNGIAVPRFSTLLGDNGALYISAGLNFQNNPWAAVPELLRTEINWRFNNGEVTAGRMAYTDPLGFIANGLFDGARISMDTSVGTFSAGAWYTGLLYKKRANITMTDNELRSSYTDLDYSDFFNTYFAPKRIVAALDWEHPGLAELVRANVSLIGQFDLANGDKLHSQYGTLKFSVPVNDFVFSLGGSFELVEATGEDTACALAGELGAAWMLPIKLQSQLSLLGRFTSGVVGGSSITAFQPITTVEQGDILQAKISGLSLIALDYLARVCTPLSFGVTSTYFIRSDKGTYQGYGSNGYFLGNEFSGRLMWSPVSDVQVNLGGGVFLPSLGNAAPDADMLWRVALNVTLALY